MLRANEKSIHIQEVLNPLQPSVAFHIETSHLICTTNQISGFYIKCNAGLKWVNSQEIHHKNKLSEILIDRQTYCACLQILQLINWKLRFDNKTFAFGLLKCLFHYRILLKTSKEKLTSPNLSTRWAFFNKQRDKIKWIKINIFLI